MLKDELKKNRPHLSETSLTAYDSTLRNLYRRVAGNTDYSVAFFKDNAAKVLDYLKDTPVSRKKSVLSALVVLTKEGKATDAYREEMMTQINKYQEELKDQERTPKQRANWVSQGDIAEVYHQLEKEVRPLMRKASLTPGDRRKIMDYVVLSLYVLVPPRRLLDYTAFKVRNVDPEKDNHLEKGKLVFVRYKTAKSYGRQEVPAPLKLVRIIRAWSRLHESDWLLHDSKGNPLTAPRLTQILNRIFGRRVSVNILRHSYVTEKILPDVPKLRELEAEAQAMGHSLQTQMVYRRD
jgi:hypothetical protein